MGSPFLKDDQTSAGKVCLLTKKHASTLWSNGALAVTVFIYIYIYT